MGWRIIPRSVFCCTPTIFGITLPGFFFFVEMNTSARAGVRKTARIMETTTAMASVDARALKKIPGTPLRNTSGTNTTRVVRVAPSNGGMISPLA